MRVINALLITTGIVMLHTQAVACEKFHSLSNEEMKENRDMLVKPDADPLDRMFAFEQLVCSDNPSLRDYAIKMGLTNSADPLVRNQVLLKAMMQKKKVVVELHPDKESTKSDKAFIAENAGVYSKIVHYRSEKEGCLSLSSDRECLAARSVFVKGNKVEYNLLSVYGQFELSQSGELIGFLRVADSSKYSRIPAVIKLF
jgi:hypothetical protein